MTDAHAGGDADYVVPLTIKGVCLDAGGRVLLCRNHRGEWELPGGRPEIGEPFPSCLAREIAEETGREARVLALVAAYPYEVIPGRWVNVIVYGATIADGGAPRVSSEHAEVRLIAASELARIEIAPGYRAAIEAWRRGPSAGRVR